MSHRVTGPWDRCEMRVGNRRASVPSLSKRGHLKSTLTLNAQRCPNHKHAKGRLGAPPSARSASRDFLDITCHCPFSWRSNTQAAGCVSGEARVRHRSKKTPTTQCPDPCNPRAPQPWAVLKCRYALHGVRGRAAPAVLAVRLCRGAEILARSSVSRKRSFTTSGDVS